MLEFWVLVGMSSISSLTIISSPGKAVFQYTCACVLHVCANLSVLCVRSLCRACVGFVLLLPVLVLVLVFVCQAGGQLLWPMGEGLSGGQGWGQGERVGKHVEDEGEGMLIGCR